jgi:hypothetical protein
MFSAAVMGYSTQELGEEFTSNNFEIMYTAFSLPE